ncbi:uncharacterized protein TNCV_231281 [Trichonephila clavipes]|nr:uncharacterized protein TNCV_231281 [Trichonephila clavipes]
MSLNGGEVNEKTRATRGLLATDHVILNHGQVTWTTPELAPPLLTTTPHQREDVSALDRFNVRCPNWARTRDKASHGLIPIPLGYRGHMVTNAWPSLVPNPSATQDPPCRGGGSTLTLLRFIGHPLASYGSFVSGVSSQVKFLLLDHGSKSQDPSPTALLRSTILNKP